MNTEEIDHFWASYEYYMNGGTMRRGQAMMNALAFVAPELYDLVTGTLADCFYSDDKIGKFRETVGV